MSAILLAMSFIAGQTPPAEVPEGTKIAYYAVFVDGERFIPTEGPDSEWKIEWSDGRNHEAQIRLTDSKGQLLDGTSTILVNVEAPMQCATPTVIPSWTPTALPAPTPTPEPIADRADFDGDGRVDQDDFWIFLNAFGECNENGAWRVDCP